MNEFHAQKCVTQTKSSRKRDREREREKKSELESLWEHMQHAAWH